MSYLDADVDRGQIAYGQFRNFMLLLPPERLERDPRQGPLLCTLPHPPLTSLLCPVCPAWCGLKRHQWSPCLRPYQLLQEVF